MKQISVTYKAPPGDAKVTEMFGHTFYDGKAETITVDDHVADKLKNNPVLKCGEATDAKEQKADPKEDEAKAKAAKAADDAKLAAQGAPPPQRGAILNKPDEQKLEEQSQQPNTRGTSGGAPDPNQPQGKKEPAQAGRDH
jgi:hypothetical protein